MVRLIATKGSNRTASIVRARVVGVALLAGLLGSAGMAAAQTGAPPEQERLATEQMGDSEQVRCLLPAQIERYGTQLTIVGQRQRVETSRADCSERGGEVVEESAAPTEPAR